LQVAEINDLIKKINDEEKDIFSFDQMSVFDLNIMHRINDKVSAKKIYETENKLIFELMMMRGGHVNLHSHNDCLEIHYVESGSILERIRNATYKKGESITFLERQAHELIALENTFLKVTVIRN
jgi:mannose-6-phosphate isomerase-like protein (cupin superfamily)